MKTNRRVSEVKFNTNITFIDNKTVAFNVVTTTLNSTDLSI